MPAFIANPGTFYWKVPHKPRGGMFRPNGRLTYHGMHINPDHGSSEKTRAGRIIVGFNVGGEPKYGMEDLIRIVKRVRQEQVGNPSSTFIAQTGICQHHSGDVVTEQGAQVIIIDTMSTKRKAFTRQMVELAETIARELEQEEVIVEIQKNGISEVTIGVGP